MCYAGATLAFGTRGIMSVARFRFRESLAGAITALATSPAFVFAVGADGTSSRKLALDIGDSGF